MRDDAVLPQLIDVDHLGGMRAPGDQSTNPADARKMNALRSGALTRRDHTVVGREKTDGPSVYRTPGVDRRIDGCQ